MKKDSDLTVDENEEITIPEFEMVNPEEALPDFGTNDSSPEEDAEESPEPVSDDPEEESSGEVQEINPEDDAEESAPESAEEEDGDDLEPDTETDSKPVSTPAPPAKKTRSTARIREEKQAAAEKQKARRDIQEEFLTGWAQLIVAKKAELILRGTIVAISTKTTARTVEVNGESHRIARYPVAFARVLLNGMYNVEIPFEEFFIKSLIDPSTVDFSTKAGLAKLERRQFTLMQKLNGLEVPFVIRAMDTSSKATLTDHFIYASRRDALLKMQKASFVGGRKLEPDFKVGDIMDAEVIAAGPQYLLLCAGGAEVRTHVRNLTYRHIPVASDFFEVGTSIPVQITEIETEGDELKSLAVSCKPLEVANAARFNLKPGDLVQGTITAVRKEPRSGFISAVAWLNQLEIPAFITSFVPRRGYGSVYSEPPKGGDVCVLEVGVRNADGDLFTTTKHGLIITRFRTLIRRGN